LPTWRRNPHAIAAAALDGLYALATNLPDPPDRELTALDALNIYKDHWIVEQRQRDLKQTLHVRPVFLHNDDRIHALVAVVGIALLIYGLIEADLRAALGPDTPLPGLLPEHHDAIPTARAVLAAFTDLHATYTTSGLVLDRLTPSNESSSPTSASPYRGPKHKASQQYSQNSATGSAKSRPAAMNGSRRANSPGSSMNSVAANSGLPTRAARRRRR
jgi:hypothetical protein